MANVNNISYKDMYHFNDKYYTTNSDNLPSLNTDPKINTSIKKNPYRSNVNIEKDEVIFKPDYTALFKAHGKKHSQGGIDVDLEPNSFVFSDDPALAFNEKDHKAFELKKGGTFSKTKNTPADVLKRNVDVKHYNTLVSNISDVHKDDLAKKSSTLMLEKYLETLGNVAYIQEQKKNFPDGTPEFSQGTAPVYDTNLKNEIMQQKQYAKYGGRIMALAGVVPCPCGEDSNGKCLPCDNSVYEPLLKSATRVKTTPPDYEKLYTNPAGSTLYGKFGNNGKTVAVPQAIGGRRPNSQWASAIQTMIDNGATPEQLAAQGHGTVEGLKQLFTFKRPSTADDYLAMDPNSPQLQGRSTPNFSVPPLDMSIPNIQPNSVTGTSGVKEANWNFTPYQKESQAYNLYKYASAKRYMPYRSQLNPNYVDSALVNPEQTVADMNTASNKQTDALGTLNPILRNAQASSIYGQLLNQIPQVRSQYDNQNVGITNQFRQSNNAITNSVRQTNMQNDQNYYQQSIIGQQNFDNMKSYLGDKYMSDRMRDVETDQSLAYNLLTQKNPAYGYNWNTGNLTRTNKDIRDVQGNGADDELKGVMDIINTIPDPYKRAQALTKLYGLKVFGPAITQQKKGGKFMPNPYK